MPLIRSRAPLRLGLAGGGTDVSPYCEEFGGLVLNATIDRYAYAIIETLETLDTPRLQLRAADQEQSLDLAADAELQTAQPLALHRAVHRVMSDEFRAGARHDRGCR